MIRHNAKLAALLALTRLSQTEVAKAAGIPRHRISALLTDDSEPRAEEKQRLAAGISELLLRKITVGDLWSVYADLPSEEAIGMALALKSNDERLHVLISDIIGAADELKTLLDIRDFEPREREGPEPAVSPAA